MAIKCLSLFLLVFCINKNIYGQKKELDSFKLNDGFNFLVYFSEKDSLYQLEIIEKRKDTLLLNTCIIKYLGDEIEEVTLEDVILYFKILDSINQVRKDTLLNDKNIIKSISGKVLIDKQAQKYKKGCNNRYVFLERKVDNLYYFFYLNTKERDNQYRYTYYDNFWIIEYAYYSGDNNGTKFKLKLFNSIIW